MQLGGGDDSDGYDGVETPGGDHSGGGGGGGGSGDEAAQDLVEILTNDQKNGILDVASSLGFIILAIGIGRLVLALKDDNAAEKSSAVMMIMGGVLLVSAFTIIKAVTGSSLNGALGD